MNVAKQPLVRAVVLGWNHAEDTIECLRSLRDSEGVSVRLLYVDNGSEPGQVAKILDVVPDAAVIRHPRNVGVPRGFNAGLARSIREGADYVFMANNDTVVEKDCIARLLAAGESDLSAGILVPTICYYADRHAVWSAGARFRRFPPAIVMRKTRGPAAASCGKPEYLEFTTLCTALVRARALKDVGLMDPTYLYYYEDYDVALRVREGGYSIRMVPEARSAHKVERVTRDAPSTPSLWRTYGRGEAIFQRRHRRHRWMTGPVHTMYLLLRCLYEGGMTGFTNFYRGLQEGLRVELKKIPAWDDASGDDIEIVRAPLV